jgi:L-ribulose-5-phosphate 3-epimerase
MRLSTSTNIHCVNEKKQPISYIESLRMCSKVGYKVMDMNFCDAVQKYSPVHGDDWEREVENISEEAEALGIEFSQCHLPFYNVIDERFAERDLYEKMVARTMEASARLGVKWAVVHAGTAVWHNRSVKVSKEHNMKYFTPMIEKAAKYNLGIAIENMADFLEGGVPWRRYTASVEELCDLVDSLNADNVGACWDFGHANLTGCDQIQSLKYVGSRLKAVHVDDNLGIYDDHVAPFHGNIDWKPIMKTLKEINYKGDFTYEIHNATAKLPDALREAALKYTFDIGQYLLSLAK